ncbi:hypothetical protein MRQ32_017375 [Pseudomonas aeruginosa]|uniref:hypothetical protein n=1 Tax=Pseudomonas aeruginosa TaxID=287 RepID=UPI001A272CCA|nr:hypothetical protein [Pseudomonas aeruginosa]MBI7127703.1 hypothetical protein [Pseudomonas aeruginosa]MBU5919246.1 hypothetical protein [Pseudomonas aeruginosa]MBU5950207.1 hypothetical protein [Pseudomonas aeruginosa]MCJ2343379.1 hypothetical protein [Pseudomonas aeruginosa]MCJ2362755.1 hypothetical protein [Pseudomonas aeruginosa]
MSEVKRYIIGRNGLPEFHDTGEYVATSDYDALAAKLAMAEDAAAKGDAARQQCGGMEMEIEELRAELAELRARVVVVPERKLLNAGVPGLNRNSGWNACLDELARLNDMTVSEGLLRRLCEPLLSHADYVVARNELRALLNENKENGNG